MNRQKISFGAFMALIVAYLFAAPYVTINQIKAAAENNDGERLSEYVDFLALRQSLRDQVNEALAVDAYVTPAGISELMSGIRPNTGEDSVRKEHAQPKPFSDARMSYDSLNKFSVTIQDDESGEEIRFILKRRISGWKLTEILIPM